MVKSTLINLAYLFYPRKICFQKEEEKYFNSVEYKRLIERIGYFNKDENRYFCDILKKDFENDKVLRNFKDVSLLDWQDRAISFNLQIVQESELHTISLFLSILIPFYTIRVQKNKIEYFFSSLEIEQMKNDNSDSREIKDLISEISTRVENKMLYRMFPNELINMIIEDINFQEIPFGKFTMFNAFFNNSITTDNEN
ncbi:hypothetical protein [Flavobacterium aquiphilum]|uniref:hypothetical protein n=1 Tax=Flavobacterium aquiphilum TaxID=3003261 RepID=UPI0024813AD3|nr:hypothetical protein [Flavobacterium aquiphilum]